ncbi:MAG: 50S ribosomal protein L24 [Planctomycetota bacterium]
MPSHVRTGDQVMIIAGDHKGKTGEVMRVDRDRDRVYIKGINLRTKHVRPTRVSPQGGIVTKEAPIHMSNVNPVVDGRATRVRFEVGADGSKTRVAARGGAELGRVRGATQKD